MSRNYYGYIKSTYDSRDHVVKFTKDHVEAFAAKKKINISNTVFDLRTIVQLPQALSEIDQGKLGSCTANAIAFAYAFDEIKQENKEIFFPSRLFIYYNERLMEGSVDKDSGAQIRDGIKSINKYGVCDEHHWIYDPIKFNIKPPNTIYDEAKLAKAVSYARIDFSQDKTISSRVAHLKKVLQSGFPFVFGFMVYESFESQNVAKTGIVPMPKSNEKVLGGHAVCCVGFDDNKKCFIVKNSWGANWGLNGYFYMPYKYMADLDLTDDFWVIKQVTNPTTIPNFSPEDIHPDARNLEIQPSTDTGVVHDSQTDSNSVTDSFVTSVTNSTPKNNNTENNNVSNTSYLPLCVVS